MNFIAQRLRVVRQRIADAEHRFARSPGSVCLLAVSKTWPAAAVQAAAAAGQRCFGENYLQEALEKIEILASQGLEWHFIGPIQANKTRGIASGFHWVHSVDRLKIARRLSDQRPAELSPLQVCLQVNISAEPSKAGIGLDELPALAAEVAKLPRLRLRGLMAVPVPAQAFEAQRAPFRALREALEDLQARGFELDTLSIGMSADLEAAVAEGATIVRIGTAIFGLRQRHLAVSY